MPVTTRWPAHNALNGWTDEHWQGDLRTPVGVYGLTYGGGLYAPPRTTFPYDQNPAFVVSGEGFDGEPLEGSFDYVVAVDYNRTPGVTPWTRAARSARSAAAASGSTSTTAARPRAASRSPWTGCGNS